jgi:ABC-type multidrug transport system ATPase subunit
MRPNKVANLMGLLVKHNIQALFSLLHPHKKSGYYRANFFIYVFTMLTHLAIKQFTLVENLELDIQTGFTVITGETGAGKSILLDALGLVFG